jgi:type IV pilus assembly protein PilV
MKHTHASGFSLLEVLIALVILSVGLLGLAALQAEGLRGSSTAQQRFQAVRLASDIADRMRSNIAGALTDAYVIAATDNAATGASNNCSDHVESGAAVAASDCTAAEMAAYDLALWRANLAALLPSGDSSVVKIAGTTGRFTVTVFWTGRKKADGSASNHTIRTEVQL